MSPASIIPLTDFTWILAVRNCAESRHHLDFFQMQAVTCIPRKIGMIPTAIPHSVKYQSSQGDFCKSLTGSRFLCCIFMQSLFLTMSMQTWNSSFLWISTSQLIHTSTVISTAEFLIIEQYHVQPYLTKTYFFILDFKVLQKLSCCPKWGSSLLVPLPVGFCILSCLLSLVLPSLPFVLSSASAISEDKHTLLFGPIYSSSSLLLLYLLSSWVFVFLQQNELIQW